MQNPDQSVTVRLTRDKECKGSVIWDEQKPANSPHGLSVVICHHGHTWETEINEDSLKEG